MNEYVAHQKSTTTELHALTRDRHIHTECGGVKLWTVVQHKNELYKSVEKDLIYQMDTNRNTSSKSQSGRGLVLVYQKDTK